MTDFQPGAGEQIRWVETDQYDVTSVDDWTVLPHGGNPTGPHKPFSRGPSDEVRSDLQVTDNPARSFTVPFSLQNVIRYGAHDLPIQQPLNARWSAAFDTGVVDTLSSAATGNKFVAGAGTPFAALATVVPCPVWVCRGGATPITGQPAIATAIGAAGAELVLATAANGGITLTDVAAGDDVQILQGGWIKNGVEEIFAMIERAQTGVGHFHAGFGMMGTQLVMTLQKGSDPTWQFTWAGRDADDATATFGSATVVAAPTTRTFNCGSDWRHFREGGAIVPDLFYRSTTITIASNVSAIDPGGMDGPHAHSKVRFQISGTASYYTNDEARAVNQKAKDKVESSLAFALQATEGSVTNAYVPWIPRVQYEDASQDGGGEGGSLMTVTPFQVATHPTFGFMFGLARFTGVPLTL